RPPISSLFPYTTLFRSIISGLLLGLILGTLGFIRVCTWQAFADAYGDHWLLVGAVVSLSLTGVVLWGSLVGSMLPFILRRFGARSEEHTSELQSRENLV